MGPFRKTRGEGLAAGTQQQGELGLLGGVQRPDEMLQSRGQQAKRATLQLEVGRLPEVRLRSDKAWQRCCVEQEL